MSIFTTKVGVLVYGALIARTFGGNHWADYQEDQTPESFSYPDWAGFGAMGLLAIGGGVLTSRMIRGENDEQNIVRKWLSRVAGIIATSWIFLVRDGISSVFQVVLIIAFVTFLGWLLSLGLERLFGIKSG